MRRNLLFLVVDCLRADICFGNPRRVQTPTIDRLAGAGAVFTQAISSATTTTPCMGSIMTGLYPFAHGILGHSGYQLTPACSTLAEVLKSHGYRTAAFVTGPLFPHTGLDRGFDDYQHRPSRAHLYTDWGPRLSEILASYAASRDPWFLFIHLWELHTPRYLLPAYDTDAFGRHRYERALACLDHYLGDLLEMIDLDSTALVFHGDHGENYKKPAGGYRAARVMRWLGFGNNRPITRVAHGYHVYEFLVRVPLFFVGRGLFPPGRVVPQLVRQIDIFPTILEALEIHLEPKVKLQGQSLLPLLRTGQGEVLPALVKACGRAIPDKRDWLVGIRTPEWKFVLAPDNPRIRPELYHLAEDPSESENVLGREPETAEQLKQMIFRIHQGYPASAMTSGAEEPRESGKDVPEEDLEYTLQ
jgi:arylsulfatase A-like enzyme